METRGITESINTNIRVIIKLILKLCANGRVNLSAWRRWNGFCNYSI